MSKTNELRISIQPNLLTIVGAVADDFYIIGECEENESGDSVDVVLIVPRAEVFRLLNEWGDEKRQYDDRHAGDWLVAGVDPEGTPALEFTEESKVPECRDGSYTRCFRVTKFDSPDLENG